MLAFALVAIAAPLTEEIAFRGIVLPAVGDRWGMWVGIGVSSVLYASIHANLWLFLPTLVLGVALGWLAWTRRSLWPAVALHVLYNRPHRGSAPQFRHDAALNSRTRSCG